MLNNVSLKFTLIIFIVVFVLVLFPIMAIPLTILLEYRLNGKYRFSRYLIALYLAYLNTNKLVESDLLNYKNYFDNSKSFEFIIFIEGIVKEPLYFLYQFFMSNLGLSFSVYLFLTTFLCYTLIFKSFDRIFVKESNFQKILAIVIISFFFELFNISAHLLRQFIASVIFLYAISFNQHKRTVKIALIASLFHSSILLYFPFLFFKPIYNKIKYKDFLKLLFYLFVLFLLIFVLTKVIKSLPFIGSVFNRVINSSDSFLTATKLGLRGYLFMGVSFLLVLISRFIKNTSLLINLIVITILFSLSMKLLGSELLAYRFMFFLYLFTPILLIKIIYNYKANIDFIVMIICVLFIVRFYSRLQNGVWNFGEIEKNLLLFY